MPFQAFHIDLPFPTRLNTLNLLLKELHITQSGFLKEFCRALILSLILNGIPLSVLLEYFKGSLEGNCRGSKEKSGSFWWGEGALICVSSCLPGEGRVKWKGHSLLVNI